MLGSNTSPNTQTTATILDGFDTGDQPKSEIIPLLKRDLYTEANADSGPLGPGLSEKATSTEQKIAIDQNYEPT